MWIIDYITLSSRTRPFETLSSEDAHEMFEKHFVKDFNSGKLPDMFYSEKGMLQPMHDAHQNRFTQTSRS
jgi:hypothetical protein